jgi:hypothetical protein
MRLTDMPAGRLAPRGLNVLFQVRLGLVGLRVPVSLGDCVISRRTIMNNAGHTPQQIKTFDEFSHSRRRLLGSTGFTGWQTSH